MIKIEIDESKKGIEIILNSEGIEELIGYLQYIRNKNEHIHLTAGNELSEEKSLNGNEIISHLKLVYLL
jgi:hypothetical protein